MTLSSKLLKEAQEKTKENHPSQLKARTPSKTKRPKSRNKILNMKN
jgi:hypothetical protein